MSKASNEALELLHATVAKVLNHQVGEEIEFQDEDTGEQRKMFTATPATISAAIKFLNDNSVTCDPAEDENLSSLADKLKKRTQEARGTLSPVGEEVH
jgi:hypothetical protein